MHNSGIKARLEWLGLALALVSHVALSLPFLATLPPFNWPDEPAHFNYLKDLAQGRGLSRMDLSAWDPVELERLKSEHFRSVDAAGSGIEGIRYEAHQPPLYYDVAALIYRLVPRIEAVKLLNLTLSCGVLVLTWLTARRLFPDSALITCAAVLFSATLPMRCFLAVSISNGVAAELLFAAFVLALVRRLPPPVIGLVVGFGLLVHSVLFLALPLYACWLALTSRSRPWKSWAVAALIAVALWSPWLVHNARTYGTSSPLSLVTGALDSDEAMVEAFGQPRPRLELVGPYGVSAFAFLLFNSFWGVFGWMEMFFGGWVQAFFGVLSIVPLLGLVRAAPRQRAGGSSSDRELVFLGVVVAVLLASVVVYSLFDFQPQGRYLLTGSVACAILYAAGLQHALGRAAAPWLAASSLGLVAVNLHGAFSVVPWYLAR